MHAKQFCQKFEYENFVDNQLTIKTSKFTSLKNFYVYGSQLVILISYVYITLDTDVQNQLQESSTIILLVCFAIVVVVSALVITILTIISVKRRRSVPSQNVNTQHYIKPPTGDYKLLIYSYTAFLNSLDMLALSNRD